MILYYAARDSTNVWFQAHIWREEAPLEDLSRPADCGGSHGSFRGALQEGREWATAAAPSGEGLRRAELHEFREFQAICARAAQARREAADRARLAPATAVVEGDRVTVRGRAGAILGHLRREESGHLTVTPVTVIVAGDFARFAPEHLALAARDLAPGWWAETLQMAGVRAGGASGLEVTCEY